MPLYLPGGGAAGPMTTAIEALATTGLIDRTGAGTATTRTAGTTGLALLAAANEAAGRAAIGAMANTAPEIISNANGTAYRWPNGLQICTFMPTTATTTPTAWGNGFVSSITTRTFPAAFNAVPTVAPANRFVTGDANSVAWEIVHFVTSTSVNFYAVGFFNNSGTRLGYVATGTYTP